MEITRLPKSSTPLLNKSTLVLDQSTLRDEMRAIARLAADPPRPGESVKSQINRAAFTLGLPARRTETFWYGRAHRVLAEEADRVRAWRRDWADRRRRALAAEMDRLDREEARMKREWNATP
jgi:hypothetical protein